MIIGSRWVAVVGAVALLGSVTACSSSRPKTASTPIAVAQAFIRHLLEPLPATKFNPSTGQFSEGVSSPAVQAHDLMTTRLQAKVSVKTLQTAQSFVGEGVASTVAPSWAYKPQAGAGFVGFVTVNLRPRDAYPRMTAGSVWSCVFRMSDDDKKYLVDFAMCSGDGGDQLPNGASLFEFTPAGAPMINGVTGGTP